MKKIIICILGCIFLYIQGQPPEVITSQIGINGGGTYYFGDLNNKPDLRQPSFFMGVFYRKYLNEYIAWRVNFNYANVGYNQALSKNEQAKIQNLSFKTDIFELSAQGDFNFYKYLPGSPKYRFTPYLTLGIGAFYFNPYTYLEGKKYSLRQYKTEGQKKPYLSLGISVPLGIGIKWNLTRQIDIGFEITYHFTSTYYLDDVHGDYAGSDYFLNDPIGIKLQDPSKTSIGIQGRQRGNSALTDQYLFWGLHLVYNLLYKQYCPTPMEDGY
ncbi:MAG: DUF6089 family protein [Chitinophagaceae bacterium]